MDYDTLTVEEQGAVLFVGINNPPMNLLGPELVRDLVSLLQRAESNDGVQMPVTCETQHTQGVRPRTPCDCVTSCRAVRS